MIKHIQQLVLTALQTAGFEARAWTSSPSARLIGVDFKQKFAPGWLIAVFNADHCVVKTAYDTKADAPPGVESYYAKFHYADPEFPDNLVARYNT